MNFKETIDAESFYNRIFKKSGSHDSVTWTAVLGREPEKRRFIHTSQHLESANLVSGLTFYLSPFGTYDTASTPFGVSRTSVEEILSSDAFTVKRFRVRQFVGANLPTDFTLMRDGTSDVVLDLSSANPADSGVITKPYDGTENMSFKFTSVTSAAPYGFDVWLEIEWDDLYQ